VNTDRCPNCGVGPGPRVCEACRANGGTTSRWQVRYFSAAHSRRGQGVRVAEFVFRADAEEFARGKRLYSKPAVVEPVADTAGAA